MWSSIVCASTSSDWCFIRSACVKELLLNIKYRIGKPLENVGNVYI